MEKARLLRKCVGPDVQTNSGVGLGAMPITAVALQLAKRGRDLGYSRFKLLQADYSRSLALNPFQKLRLARANSIHVPGCDL